MDIVNLLGLPFAFMGIATIVTRRLVDESGTAVIEGTPAVLIGAVFTTIGLWVTFLV